MESTAIEGLGNQPTPHKKHGAVLTMMLMVGLVWLALALRLHQLGRHSLWYDELLELDIAQGALDEIGPQLIRHAAMPLDYYLLHGWINLGRQDAWVRFPALFFGVLAVPLIYALGKRLFCRRVGLFAAALLAVSSFAVSYSQEARPYALLMTMVLLGWLGLWRAYQTHQLRYWGVAGFGLVGAALSHYFTLFVLAPVGLFVAVQQLYHPWHKKYWQHTIYFIGVLFIVGAVFAVNGRLGHLYSVGERFAREIDQPELYTLPAVEKPNRGTGPPLRSSFFVEKVLIPLGTVNSVQLLLYNLFLLASILPLCRYRASRRAAILLVWAWLILPILLIYAFLLHRGTFFAIRYILFTLPAYLILVAYGVEVSVSGLVGLGNRLLVANRQSTFMQLTRRYAGFVIAVFVLWPLLQAQIDENLVYYTTESREDWRAVGQMLKANARPADAIIAVNAEPALNWYYPPATAPFGTYRRNKNIWRAINQHPRRWFVLSSYSNRLDAGLRDWLIAQGAVKIAIDRRVEVYYHHEGKTYAEMLAEVKTFALPQKALTYRILADQFLQQGDVTTSRIYYQKAAKLAGLSIVELNGLVRVPTRLEK